MRLSILVKLLASLLVSAALLTAQSAPVEVVAVRHEVLHGTTRVILECSGEFEFQSNRLHSPERVYFDLRANARKGLPSSYPKEFEGELISGVRMAQPAAQVTRVVLDLLEQVDVATTRLRNPARLLIELRPAAEPDRRIPKSVPMPNVAAKIVEQGPAQPQPPANPRHDLTLTPTSATPGSVAAVRLELSFSAGEEPLALEWELTYPSPKLGIEDGDMVAGDAAIAAGKTLNCAGQVKGAGEYVYRCIVAGGVKRMSNGSVALINFRVRPSAPPGPATVRIGNALAVTAGGGKVTIPPSQADITIR